GRLRNIQAGELAGTTICGADGTFTFAGLNVGNYVVEVLDAAGLVVATSAPILLTAATMAVTGLAGTASAAIMQGGAAVVGGGAFLTSSIGIVSMAAAAAGVTGVV